MMMMRIQKWKETWTKRSSPRIAPHPRGPTPLFRRGEKQKAASLSTEPRRRWLNTNTHYSRFSLYIFYSIITFFFSFFLSFWLLSSFDSLWSQIHTRCIALSKWRLRNHDTGTGPSVLMRVRYTACTIHHPLSFVTHRRLFLENDVCIFSAVADKCWCSYRGFRGNIQISPVEPREN